MAGMSDRQAHLAVDVSEGQPAVEPSAELAEEEERYSDEEFDALSDGEGEGEEEDERPAPPQGQLQGGQEAGHHGPQAGAGGGVVSPARAPSSPASSLESPDRPDLPGGGGDPLQEIMRMLGQMQAVRADAQVRGCRPPPSLRRPHAAEPSGPS